MTFTRAGRIFEAFLFAAGTYYSFVEDRSLLDMTVGRVFYDGSSVMYDLWQWREFTCMSDWAWQWSSVPTPLESPRAASLDAAVSLRMPSLIPYVAGSAGTSHNASSSSPISSGDYRQLHALLDALRNSSHLLQCQQRQGQTFMYFDSGANDGLLPDEALGPISVTGKDSNGRRRRYSKGIGLGDGGMIEAVEVEVGEWLLRTELITDAVFRDSSRWNGDSSSSSSSSSSSEKATLYCVEELALDWSRTRPTHQSPSRKSTGAWAMGGGASLSWTPPQPLDELSSALLPYVESCLPFVAATAPDAGAYSPPNPSATGNSDSAPAASVLHEPDTSNPSGSGAARSGDCTSGDGLPMPPSWQPPTVNVWMHSAGAVTPTHYDTWHNMLVQVSGRKRVTLLPPSAHPCVYLFPSLHPRARKSQVPVYARGPLTSSSCSCSRASDSQRTPMNAGAGADSLRQECCSDNNGNNGKINGNACSYDRRDRNFAPHFLSFVQNGTWFGPNQNPTPLERQFPKFVHYLRTGTCDLPAGGFSQNASSHPIERSTFASSFAARGRQRPWIVVLEPGDALYIPPLWLHSVETLEASISVNTFAPSIEDNEASKALYQVPLPFEPRWPLRMRARATVKYLTLLANELDLNLGFLVRELLASRYRMARSHGNDEGQTSAATAEDDSGDVDGASKLGDAIVAPDSNRRRRTSSSTATGRLSSSDRQSSNACDDDDDEESSLEEDLMREEESVDQSEELDARISSESARLREWLPWCREPAADDTLKRTKTRAFVAAARAHTNVLGRLKDPALVQTTFEDLVELSISSAFGPKAVPLFLCACFSPAPTRAVLLGPQPLDLSTCVAQWDFYN